jgi:hypothetical protein
MELIVWTSGEGILTASLIIQIGLEMVIAMVEGITQKNAVMTEAIVYIRTTYIQTARSKMSVELITAFVTGS